MELFCGDIEKDSGQVECVFCGLGRLFGEQSPTLDVGRERNGESAGAGLSVPVVGRLLKIGFKGGETFG